MKPGDVVQLKNDAIRNSLVQINLMTVEDVRENAVTVLYLRDGLIRREEIRANCLVVVTAN